MYTCVPSHIPPSLPCALCTLRLPLAKCNSPFSLFLLYTCTAADTQSELTRTHQRHRRHVGLWDCSSCRDPRPSTLCGHQGRFGQMVSDWGMYRKSGVWTWCRFVCISAMYSHQTFICYLHGLNCVVKHEWCLQELFGASWWRSKMEGISRMTGDQPPCIFSYDSRFACFLIGDSCWQHQRRRSFRGFWGFFNFNSSSRPIGCWECAYVMLLPSLFLLFRSSPCLSRQPPQLCLVTF